MKLLIALLIPLSLFALTDKQAAVMVMVKAEATKWTKYPTTIAAICGAETSFGNEMVGDINGGVLNASYGWMQITLQTAKEEIARNDLLKDLRNISNSKLITLLLTNLKVSVKVASCIFNRNIKARKSYFKAISCYNGGLHNYRYYNRVMKFKKIVLKELR